MSDPHAPNELYAWVRIAVRTSHTEDTPPEAAVQAIVDSLPPPDRESEPHRDASVILDFLRALPFEERGLLAAWLLPFQP